MIIAMATAIGFATRGAMAGNREIIEVLHFVGAADTFIAKQFQTHFMRLGSRGAAIGGIAAASFFVAASLLSTFFYGSTGEEEIAALFGAFSLSGSAYLAIFVICVAIAGLTGLLSRVIVFNHLRTLM
jgi:cell division transport system permease protein